MWCQTYSFVVHIQICEYTDKNVLSLFPNHLVVDFFYQLIEISLLTYPLICFPTEESYMENIYISEMKTQYIYKMNKFVPRTSVFILN